MDYVTYCHVEVDVVNFFSRKAFLEHIVVIFQSEDRSDNCARLIFLQIPVAFAKFVVKALFYSKHLFAVPSKQLTKVAAFNLRTNKPSHTAHISVQGEM